jgi:hypothetical protein
MRNYSIIISIEVLEEEKENINNRRKNIIIYLELPIPTIESLNDLEDRLIRILRTEQGKNSLCFRYGDLCSLDTIQVDVVPEKKGKKLILFKKKHLYVFVFRCYYTTF